MKPPIIIGSAPSSGSTLLRVLLGRHPSIAAGGEVGLFDKRALLLEPASEYRRSIRTWLEQGYPANFLGPSTELFEELDDYPWDWDSVKEMCFSVPDFPSMVEQFHKKHMDIKRADRWLDKCPSNIYCFDLIASLYPSAKFIHIIRDGRDCVVSFCRRGGTPFRAVSRWYYATLCGIQYRGWKNYLEIRYEDLVRRPELVLRRICDFIEEKYIADFYQPDTRIFNSSVKHKKMEFVKWRYSATAPIQSGSIKQYQQQMSHHQRAMFSHVGLSVHGARLLYKNTGSPGMFSPIKLQKFLGHSTDGILNAPTLDADEITRSWREYEKHQGWMSRRYQTLIEPEVQLNYNPS